MSVGADLMQWTGEPAAWIGLLGEATAKGTLLLLAALLVVQVLRRGSAASRHLVWASCLGLLLLLPLLAQIAPAIPAPVIPHSWSAAWDGAIDATGSGLADLLGVPDGSIHTMITASAANSSGHIDAGTAVGTSVHLSSPALRGETVRTAATWLITVWLAGVALVLGWLAIGLWLRWSLSRRAQIVRSGPCMEAARSVAAQLGLKRDLVLLRGADDAVPMTWGSLRPVVYLPPGAEDWSAEQRRSVLLHELAHVRRWDSLTRSVSQLACAVFWFHPLTWYAAHRLLKEQERACDDMVLLAGAEPDEYATTLLTLARRYRHRRPAVVGALALARRTTLENRLVSILDPRRKRITMSRPHRFVLLATFVAIVIPLASLQPAPAEPAVTSAQPAIASGGTPWTPAASQQGAATATTAEETDPVQMIIKGDVHLGSSLDEIEVGPGGRFVIQEIQGVDDHLELDAVDPDHGRRLEITADAEGNVEQAWKVDGVTQRLDAEARSWIDSILGRLGGRVFHMKPGMVWRTEKGDQSTIDIHLSRLHVDEEGGEWTIHVSDPEALLHEGEAGQSIFLKLERGEGDKSFTFVTPEKLTVLGEGDERKVYVVVPKGDLGEQEISAVVVTPRVEIIEEAGEARAVVIVEPRIVTETTGEHGVHIEIVREPHVVVDVRTDEHSEHTITMDIDDEDSHMTVRMRGEVDFGETVDEIEVGEGGELSIDERDAEGVVRQLSIRPGPDGNLLFEFFVDGTERPFDTAARAWLERILERINT